MEGLLGPGVTYVEGTNLPAPYGTYFSELIEAEKGSSTPQYLFISAPNAESEYQISFTKQLFK